MAKYINKNDEVYDVLHQLGMDLRDKDNDFFKIKTKHGITVSPMKEYVEWLIKSLIKITKSYQQETIAPIMPPPSQQTPTNK